MTEIIEVVERYEVPEIPALDLPEEDGVPLETNWHRAQINLLIDIVTTRWRERTDYFVGGNMFIYYSSTQARNNDFRGPDFFAVLNVDGTIPRQGWVVWEENGRYPDVIVELMSPSTAQVNKVTKKEIYQQTFRTPDYFVYDPFDPNSLQGWHLDSDKGYQPITPNPQGWLWSQSLGLWVGTWQGQVEDDNAVWLRFYDEVGNVVLLPEEAQQQRADAEQQRADAERQARLNAVSRLLDMGMSQEQVAQVLSLSVAEVEIIRNS